MTAFDLAALLEKHQGEGVGRWDEFLNPQMAGMLKVIGFRRTWVSGEGAYLRDHKGDGFLDFISGFGACAAGRGHPVVRQAIRDVLDAGLADLVQMDTPLLPGLLAGELLKKAPGLDRACFCSSGAEAVETALKFARAATGRSRILHATHAFHGLTLGALSVNGSAEFRDGFGTLLPAAGIPAGDLGALRGQLRRGGVAALIIEPVQGHGTYVVPDGYLAEAARLCRHHGALLIADEVQTGLGRTGKWFAYQHEPGCVPDIVTVAKALSGGYIPVGAVLASDQVFQSVYRSAEDAFRHSGTFSGNAAAMAAGLATLHVIEDEGLIQNAAVTGTALRTGLASMVCGDAEMLSEVRGRGLMLGAAFRRPETWKLWRAWNDLARVTPSPLSLLTSMDLFARHRILTAPSGGGLDVLRLLPPLTIGAHEVSTFLCAFAQVMGHLHEDGGLMTPELARS